MTYGKTGIPPSISVKYPTNRDLPLKTAYNWLAGRQKDENAEGLWRIYDKLYDLTNFIKDHPGGQDWLLLTKGLDITEAFECHHVTLKPEQILPKYYVREAKQPRNFKFTFHEDGFYKTLKRRVREKLPKLNKSKKSVTNLILDSLLFLTYSLAILSARFNNYLIAFLSGLCLTWTVIAAHNFFHQKDNWRMRAYNLSLLSFREWRISHALSHHIYPNTLHDLEVSYFEPFYYWIPSTKLKTSLSSLFAVLRTPLIYSLLFASDFIKRLWVSLTSKHQLFHWDDIVVPFSVPFFMFLFGQQNLYAVMKIWAVIIWSGSVIFSIIGINAAHHHPEIVHEGDAHNPTMDWGIFQLDAVMDRTEVRGILLTLTHFGDHGLHHLFPTIDHVYLPELEEELFQTCKEFETQLRVCPWWNLIKGQFQQLRRTEVNPVPVAKRKKNL